MEARIHQSEADEAGKGPEGVDDLVTLESIEVEGAADDSWHRDVGKGIEFCLGGCSIPRGDQGVDVN